MSLLLKGIDMPKEQIWGVEVVFRMEKDGSLYSINEMIEPTQVVEIPTPHGRMIDADALFEAMGLDTVKEVMFRNWKFNTAWGVPIIETEE